MTERRSTFAANEQMLILYTKAEHKMGQRKKNAKKKQTKKKLTKKIVMPESRGRFAGREANAAQLHREHMEVHEAADFDEGGDDDPGSECRPRSYMRVHDADLNDMAGAAGMEMQN
jgi:hypothetical protein